MDAISWYGKLQISLTEFNKRVFQHTETNKSCIILHSEDTDMIRSYAMFLAHWISKEENKKKVAYVIGGDSSTISTTIKLLKEISKKAHLKIIDSGYKSYLYKNGCVVRFKVIHEHPVFNDDEKVDLLISMDMDKIKSHIFMRSYNMVKPMLIPNESKIIFSSLPAGRNIFYKLFCDAERGRSNMAPLRLYYWEDGRKDGKWVMEKERAVGIEQFNIKWNLKFVKSLRDSTSYYTEEDWEERRNQEELRQERKEAYKAKNAS